MKLVVFGLTISSSWGNGHATLWRALCRALGERGHRVTFFERDVPYYAAHRDIVSPDGCDLRLYDDWENVREEALRASGEADFAIVTSYCPDARAAALVAQDASSHSVFYDMDTPITLDAIERGVSVPYIPERGLGDFDLVLSFTGGVALERLASRLGATRVAPLYGSVDPLVHHVTPAVRRRRSDLSYIGTYAEDRQSTLDRLFFEAARRRPDARLMLAGSQYPADFAWEPNVYYLTHLPPGDHAAFYSSSAWTLNVTRAAMALLGYCPSGRLFEAAACGTAIVTDRWPGLDEFFTPGYELLIADTTEDVIAAMDLSEGDRRAIGARARERALDCHTATVRANELEILLEGVPSWRPRATPANSSPVGEAAHASTGGA
jgi:spore maturation protein CgeB